jgi:molybdopterin-biosynthesis enzyme MoeA-like protein
MKKYFIPGYPEQIRVMLKWFLGSHKLSETPANLSSS